MHAALSQTTLTDHADASFRVAASRAVEDAFRGVLAEVAPDVREVSFRFYPYTTLKMAARFRDDGVYVGVSDLLEGVPHDTAAHLARYLLYPLFRRRVPNAATEAYRRVTADPAMDARVSAARRERARRTVCGTRGARHDLAARFDALNARFFDGRLDRPTLTWSRGRPRTTLGLYDHDLKTIVVSRRLDSAPQTVLDYVLHHEMLHMVFPTLRRGGRRSHHPRAFKERERAFPGAADGEAWIRRKV